MVIKKKVERKILKFFYKRLKLEFLQNTSKS